MIKSNAPEMNQNWPVANSKLCVENQPTVRMTASETNIMVSR
ncbi:MAG: hypothetical protein WCK27_18530 [Verrucomicrobiota bacterium]